MDGIFTSTSRPSSDGIIHSVAGGSSASGSVELRKELSIGGTTPSALACVCSSSCRSTCAAMLFSISEEEEEEEEEEESEPDKLRPFVERPRKINAISSSCTHKTNIRINDFFSLQIA